MPSVTVTALTAFEHNGRAVSPGDPVELTVLEAAIWARKGTVSLTKRTYATRELKASDPEPEPEKPKRRYRRRDLQAETE